VVNVPPEYASGNGFEQYIETSGLNAIRYRYRYGAPYRSQPVSTKIMTVSILPADISKCSGDIPKPGYVLQHGEGWREMTCEFDVSKGVDISVVTTAPGDPVKSVVVPPILSQVEFASDQEPDKPYVAVTCIALGDSDIAAGTPVRPGKNKTNDLTREIRFGAWDNAQCGTSSAGITSWYITNQGTCLTGKGGGIKGCQKVEAYLLPQSQL